MLSTNDFVLQYETLSDEELYTIYSARHDYSAEAQEALEIVLQKKGGQDELIQRLKERQIYVTEVNRIGRETVVMSRKGVDIDFIKSTMTSPFLSSEEVNEIIDKAVRMVTREADDKKIKPRTIVGSIFGALSAGILGGFLWGLWLLWAPERMPMIIIGLLLAGVVLLSYGVVKLFTRQSQKNVVVLIATIVSFFLSLFIGQLFAAILQ